MLFKNNISSWDLGFLVFIKIDTDKKSSYNKGKNLDIDLEELDKMIYYIRFQKFYDWKMRALY